MGKLIDLTGQRFGRLTVIERCEDTKSKKTQWKCKCDCDGKIITVFSGNLTSGHTRSCGCLNKKRMLILNKKHGLAGTRLYRIWVGIKSRVANEHSEPYENYGGRGITICEEWENDFQKFKNWAFKNGYSNNLTIDRIDNDKGYSPKNCRWINRKKQSNNRRSNRKVTFQGETRTIAEWCDYLNINQKTMSERINKLGWSIEKAFTTPVRKYKKS